MGMREHDDIAPGRAAALDHPVRALGDLRGRLASGRAVVEERPPRALGADVDRRAAFVLAVVPLDEVGVEPRAFAEPGELARLERALQWARQHERVAPRREHRAEALRLRPALVVERNVGATRMPARARPLGLAVA